MEIPKDFRIDGRIQIDRAGRVIDYEKNKARLAIIEQEFKQAEKAEALRKKEEEDLRVSELSARSCQAVRELVRLTTE